MRVDGKFVDLERNVPQGQYVSILRLFMGCLGTSGIYSTVNGCYRCFCTCCGGAMGSCIGCFCRVNRCRRNLCQL